MKKTLTAVIIAGALTAGSFVAGESFAIDVHNEVKAGSILTTNHSESEFPNLSIISYARAVETALRAVNGKLLDIGLEDDNGFLVWEVEIVGPGGMENVVKIDAGDGRVLAAGRAEEDDREEVENENGTTRHSKWKFWEKDKKNRHEDKD